MIINDSLDPPTPFFKGEEVNFDYLPWREEGRKGWKYGVEASVLNLLRTLASTPGAGTFTIYFFQGLSFFI